MWQPPHWFSWSGQTAAFPFLANTRSYMARVDASMSFISMALSSLSSVILAELLFFFSVSAFTSSAIPDLIEVSFSVA